MLQFYQSWVLKEKQGKETALKVSLGGRHVSASLPAGFGKSLANTEVHRGLLPGGDLRTNWKPRAAATWLDGQQKM